MGYDINDTLEGVRESAGYAAWKFNQVGSKISGVIEAVNEIAGKNLNTGEPERSVVFELRTASELSCRNGKGETVTGTEWAVYWKTEPTTAQGLRALKKVLGGARLNVGDTVAWKLAEKQDVGKPQPMNVFEAAHKAAPAPVVLPDAVDDDDPLI